MLPDVPPLGTMCDDRNAGAPARCAADADLVMGRPERPSASAVVADELRKDYLRERIRAEMAERNLGQIVKLLYREGAARRLFHVASEQFSAARVTRAPEAAGTSPLPREVRTALEEWRRRREAARMAYAAIPDAMRRDLPSPVRPRDRH
jgi:hypothetical protein